MWQRTAVLVALIVVVNCIDVRLLKRYHGSSIKVDCFDYPEPKDFKYFRSLEGYRKKEPRFIHTTPKYRPPPKLARRSDYYNKEDIVKEHAKLVQDINSLRQVLFVPPLADESKDYEDSIFHEILETSTTAKPTLTTQKQRNGIPIILAGTASQTVTSQPIKLNKETINLVGSSVSPIVKHPYPFDMPTRSPLRVCMATPLSTRDPYAIKRRPSLWQRIVNTLEIYPSFKL
ncbi:uncharacterized protein LOC123718863 [Pieris brassicae]|uniref:Uncharacterized protein n=1 Tax=Pieris brassicae TaxID=7116 RepID=A0A9P0U0J5_PIEBR|nr:uncharacterized protein LOC123718863 [Pieris brassicae]CAH4038344.1 unnamed protein product [Pieris brassicae]